MSELYRSTPRKYKSLILHNHFRSRFPFGARTFRSLCICFGSSKGRMARRKISAFFRRTRRSNRKFMWVSVRSFSLYTILPHQTLRPCTSTKKKLRLSVPTFSIIFLIINFCSFLHYYYIV